MRATYLLTTAAAILVLLVVPRARAATPNPREQWLVQARAADAIGEVLMAASERAEEQVGLLRRTLATADEKKAVTPATPASVPATRDPQAAYRALFDRVAAEVRRGAAISEPSLDDLPDGQLFSEMAALQSYNLRTFRRLGELREQAAGLRHRLEAIGKWKGDATTRPAIETPDVLPRQALATLKREQRSPRWAEARQKMRNAIASRSRQFRQAMPTPSSPHAPPADGVVIDDPRWQPYYYGPGDQFGGWDEAMYGNPFRFRGGGGVYERYDTRVNTDFDTRTRGQADRRVNVESDRRLNVHVDPRQNF